MVVVLTNKTMNRQTNCQALRALLDEMKKSPNAEALIAIRRAAYLHAIVELVLSERVAALPEAPERMRVD